MSKIVAPSLKIGVRKKLLDAAVLRIRGNGYAATTVDQLCADAGVTKGAFFHHFNGKDALAIAAANYWTEITDPVFEEAPYQKYSDPLDRVFGYLDFRKSLLKGEVVEFTCLLGTMVQELHGSHPEIRNICASGIVGHAEKIEADIATAMKAQRIRATWTAASLALHTQAVLQGAFILAKATGNAQVAESSIDHLRRYIELLFGRSRGKKGKTISSSMQ
jgi:TetR/AcrR family transcriptional repressor of nem operon